MSSKRFLLCAILRERVRGWVVEGVGGCLVVEKGALSLNCSGPPPPTRHPTLHSSHSDDIIRWVKKKTGPATTEVATAEALEAAQKESKVVVLAFLEKFEGDAHTAYEAGEFWMKTDAGVSVLWVGVGGWCWCCGEATAGSG